MSRLYECISEMKKGSRSGYDAETGKQSVGSESHSENPMTTLHYIGFDVHKKSISFCVKTAAGEIVEEGSLLAQRGALRQWASARPQSWRGALEATLFSGWIYDTLKPYGEQLEMAHPAKMKAISGQEEKRHHRRPHHRRPGALQSLARLLCGRAAHSRTAPPAALSQSGGERSGAHEEQNGRLLMETGAVYVKEKLHGKNTLPAYWKSSKRCRNR